MYKVNVLSVSDGWPQEISEHNEQSLMNAQNINDDSQLKGFLSVGTFYKNRAHVCQSVRLCMRY